MGRADSKMSANQVVPAAAGEGSEAKTKQQAEAEIIKQFQKLKEEKNNVSTKMAEIKMDKNEHEMCTKTMSKFDASRKCWRLVGGVLVERTVGEVLPAVQENVANVRSILTKLDKMHDEKEEEILAFMRKYNIVVKGAKAPDEETQAQLKAVEAENQAAEAEK